MNTMHIHRRIMDSYNKFQHVFSLILLTPCMWVFVTFNMISILVFDIEFRGGYAHVVGATCTKQVCNGASADGSRG